MVRTRRRGLAALALLAGGGLAPGILGCGAPIGSGKGGTLVAVAPARALALTAADLPGFQVAEELAPALAATGADDPYGRVGSYSVTFLPAARAATRDDTTGVTSSVNTYAGAAHARAAFEAWQAAIPRQYRPDGSTIGLPPGDSAAFVRDGAILVGFRVRNVLASVRAPQERAAQLARTMIARIEAAAR